jgi:hypothetical protein
VRGVTAHALTSEECRGYVGDGQGIGEELVSIHGGWLEWSWNGDKVEQVELLIQTLVPRPGEGSIVETIFDRILTVNLIGTTVVFYVAARLYVFPRLGELTPRSVLLPILLLHSLRHLGLMFLTRGAVYPGMPPQFAYPAAVTWLPLSWPSRFRTRAAAQAGRWALLPGCPKHNNLPTTRQDNLALTTLNNLLMIRQNNLVVIEV